MQYSCEVGAGVPLADGAAFAAKVDAVLADPRGWAQHGVAFQRVPLGAARHLTIRLVAREIAEAGCSMAGFSCWRPPACGLPADILINYHNWMGGSKSRLPLDRYRTYVVNHEVGHALGLDHATCPEALAGAPAPVMMQMTRGPDHVRPCVENEWPLATEVPPPAGRWPSPLVQPRVVARRPRPAPATWAVLILLVVIVLALFSAAHGRVYRAVARRLV